MTRAIQKSVRAELRELGIKPEKIVLVENKTQAFIVAKHLLAHMYPRHQIPIGKKGLTPISRDELNTRFLSTFFENKEDLLDEQFILGSVSYEDLQEYAKKHSLKIIPLDVPLDIYELLANLEKEQPQTMPALYNSYVYLRKELGRKEEEKISRKH